VAKHRTIEADLEIDESGQFVDDIAQDDLGDNVLIVRPETQGQA